MWSFRLRNMYVFYYLKTKSSPTVHYDGEQIKTEINCSLRMSTHDINIPFQKVNRFSSAGRSLLN